ncbi:MAG: aldose 1-epimerase family protein [Nocardioidaceae bacterium]
MVGPSGEQFEIAAGGYRAVVTECGATLRSFAYGDRALLDGFGAHEMASAGRGQLLAPWVNRIRDGRYELDGSSFQLALTEVARRNASHGLVRWAAWSLEERTANSVSLVCRLMAQSGYPWTLDLHALFDVSADGLTVTVTATNQSGSEAPYAVGAHPYLRVGDGPVDGLELTLPAGTRLLTDPERKLPTGTEPVDGTEFDFRASRPIRATVLDHAFTDLVRDAQGRATTVLLDPATGDGVALWVDERHHWIQVYSGEESPATARRSLAVEPMTAPPDAFNSGTDLVRLAPAGSPGDEHSASWGIRALHS